MDFSKSYKYPIFQLMIRTWRLWFYLQIQFYPTAWSPRSQLLGTSDPIPVIDTNWQQHGEILLFFLFKNIAQQHLMADVFSVQTVVGKNRTWYLGYSLTTMQIFGI